MSLSAPRKRLLLAGGGHAQLSVLHTLAEHRPDVEAVLVTPGPHQIYSGMLPGWMAGHYALAECCIDLRPLAQAANVKLLQGQVTGIDAGRQRVTLGDGAELDYDLLSVDVGGETDLSWLGTLGKRLLPVKPLGGLVRRWPKIVDEAERNPEFKLIVVGGGAAGVEIAFAAQHALGKIAHRPDVSLVASEHGLLQGHAPGVAGRVRDLLARRGIVLHESRAAGVEDGILLGNGRHLPADIVIAATGSTPPRWLQTSQLALDEHGYLCVGATHQSISHPNVFAAGDVCARADITLAHSGVHAVFAGPVVANNLIASLSGGKLIPYRPRKRSLYLLATGPKHAIASWGPLSAAGNWIWRWKNHIDRSFMRKHGSGDARHD